jgi:hypothetical protein
MEMMFPKYANWVSIKWTKESAKSILRKYNEIEKEIGGEQELPPVVDLFKEMQDGFDNVAEDAIIYSTTFRIEMLSCQLPSLK